jgi:hypothetical protein
MNNRPIEAAVLRRQSHSIITNLITLNPVHFMSLTATHGLSVIIILEILDVTAIMKANYLHHLTSIILVDVKSD